jgi:hypothetical protein
MSFVDSFVWKIMIFGFALGCDGVFTTLFVMGINETSGKL